MEEKDYKKNLHQNAKAFIFSNAGDLRRRETEAEKKLWPFLRNRKLLNRKFRRQHAFADYILDFYCHECKLVVELDGAIHDTVTNRQYDEARTLVLNEYNITVIRFTNKEVMNNVEKVLEKISEFLG